MRRALTQAALTRIEAGIQQSESAHRGEIRFVAEGSLHLPALMQAQTPRARAIELFSQLRVWDTEENTGVLVYLQLLDRHVEIVADRGINARVAQHEWDVICSRMQTAFSQRLFEDGVMAGLDEITALLARHFPARAENANELPDRPLVI